jgi:hypothetical protein
MAWYNDSLSCAAVLPGYRVAHREGSLPHHAAVRPASKRPRQLQAMLCGVTVRAEALLCSKLSGKRRTLRAAEPEQALSRWRRLSRRSSKAAAAASRVVVPRSIRAPSRRHAVNDAVQATLPTVLKRSCERRRCGAQARRVPSRRTF